MTVYIRSSLGAKLEPLPTATRWVIVDPDAERVARWERHLAMLGPRVRFDGLMDRASEALLAPFNAAIERIGEREGGPWWICSNLNERNPDCSPLFAQCCQLWGLLHLLQTVTDTDWVVLVPDRALQESLAVSLQAQGTAVRLPPRLPRRPEQARRAVSLVKGVASRWLFLRRLRRTERVQAGRGPVSVLIHSWITPSCRGGVASFERAYFGGLPNWLESHGIRTQFLVFPSTNVSGEFPEDLLDELACAGRLFPLSHYVRVSDVLGAAVETARPRRLPQDMRVNLAGADATALFSSALQRESSSLRLFDGLLIERTMKRASRDRALPPAVLYTFENQPWEKALCMGVHSAHGPTQLVGYMHSSIPRNYANFTPLATDWRRGARPDVVAANGRVWAAWARQLGWTDVQLAPAFRYPLPPSRPQGPGTDYVLVAGPSSSTSTKALLRLCLQALGSHTVAFKGHPALGDHALSEIARRELPPGWTVLDPASDIRDALQGAWAVIYQAGTVGFDALAAGVPLIRVELEAELSQPVLPQNRGFETVVTTPGEMKSALATARAVPPEAVREAWLEAFEPVSETATASFVSQALGVYSQP